MYKHIYFIGIGGIGMSAIARYYNFKGLDVSGYDRTESELTRQLIQEGIRVHYTDSPELIPQSVQDTLVVYTPAIPEDLQELVTVRQKGYKVAQAHFKYLNPLPKNTAEVLSKYNKVVVAEQNMGQLAAYLRMKVDNFVPAQFNQVKGQPFVVEELVNAFEDILKK